MSCNLTEVFRSSSFKKASHLRWYATSMRAWGRAPSTPCCYVMLDSNRRAIYVGSTNNLCTRIRHHRNSGRFADEVALVKYRPSKKYGDWLMLEARLIRRLQPIYNQKLVESKYA